MNGGLGVAAEQKTISDEQCGYLKLHGSVTITDYSISLDGRKLLLRGPANMEFQVMDRKIHRSTVSIVDTNFEFFQVSVTIDRRKPNCCMIVLDPTLVIFRPNDGAAFDCIVDSESAVIGMRVPSYTFAAKIPLPAGLIVTGVPIRR